ncbi:hypothetical protein H206_01215 [Candidatus Electrothrix aarhusensis]|uniref:Uncharacterized protein n=1 Tax=Candidatus Electrothrix aarhusensis TaxID=1859131 RepID=A0A444IW43_9BACT|nr:hypothetical protein H206_01215 [Candidatus Electrothrix aarhusensis]
MNTADRQNNRHAQDGSTSVFRLETMRTYLEGLMDQADSAKLMQCSPAVIEPIFNGATRMNPASLFLNTGSKEDMPISGGRHSIIMKNSPWQLQITPAILTAPRTRDVTRLIPNISRTQIHPSAPSNKSSTIGLDWLKCV